jgi:glycerophosphoryl diester phosphodiesterase
MSTSGSLIVAGATGYGAWPANSLEGALRCLDAPVDGIEIDVQITSDGVVVAHHDYRLNPSQTRLDGEWLGAPSAPLKTMPLAELKRYDIGRERPHPKYPPRHPQRVEMDNVRIPTLPELLAALKAAPGPRRLLYVEVKTSPQDMDEAPAPKTIVDAVFRDLEAADYAGHAKIIAFDWQVLRLSRERCAQIRTAHLTIPSALKSSIRFDADGRSPWTDGHDPRDHDGSELRAIIAHGGMEWSPYFSEVTAESAAQASALGLLVGPWGLSSHDDIRRMQQLGVFSATVSGPDWG